MLVRFRKTKTGLVQLGLWHKQQVWVLPERCLVTRTGDKRMSRYGKRCTSPVGTRAKSIDRLNLDRPISDQAAWIEINWLSIDLLEIKKGDGKR